MLVQASQGQSGSAHVVVLGNEKGGSGKSTTALHVAVALLKAGQRVASIDLDCRQQSFTRYIENRRAWARRTGLDLELPVHSCIKYGQTMQIEDNEKTGMPRWDAIIDATVHRLRPILLTAAAAILGLIPIAGSAFWGPMSFAMMGGLLVATVLTLIFLSALYAVWYRIAPRAVAET